MDYEQRLTEAKSIYNAGLERVKTTPTPKDQKFAIGALVRIADLSGDMMMSHFESNCPACVEYTYTHAFGGQNAKDYSLLVRHPDGRWWGRWWSIAWYPESTLTLIEDPDEIARYREEIEAQAAQHD